MFEIFTIFHTLHPMLFQYDSNYYFYQISCFVFTLMSLCIIFCTSTTLNLLFDNTVQTLTSKYWENFLFLITFSCQQRHESYVLQQQLNSKMTKKKNNNHCARQTISFHLPNTVNEKITFMFSNQRLNQQKIYALTSNLEGLNTTKRIFVTLRKILGKHPNKLKIEIHLYNRAKLESTTPNFHEAAEELCK